MVRGKLALLLALSLVQAIAWGQALPETGANVHEGVASCATGVCHGKVSADPASTVWLNEYRTWLRQDYHSRAYRTLQSAQSTAIANKLGLASAAGAKICLDCHSDNVPADSRGRRFQISDGVSCEACHGGAGKWLESHAEKTTSHADNLKAGMYPTEQPMARAKLCLSCHLGTKDKFATHVIMGAGHPRLSFELETFTVNQPAHYQVDADYRERKPAIASVNMWLAGLTVTSTQYLDLLQLRFENNSGLVPELSFYQCHACHHPMDDLRWSPEGGRLPPGSLRLNDGPMQVFATVAALLGADTNGTITDDINQLHSASAKNISATKVAAQKLQKDIESLGTQLVNANYDKAKMQQLRRGLLQSAANGQYRHFTSAEQIFLAVDTLSISVGDAERLSTPLDAWFKSVEDENKFVPQQYAVLARKLLEAL